MKKSLLLVISLIFISSCTPPDEKPEVNTAGEVIRANPDRTIDIPAPVIETQGLGNLCSDEEECVNFCLNNRGRCENYCRGNQIELCRIIFPPNADGEPEAVNVENGLVKYELVGYDYIKVGGGSWNRTSHAKILRTEPADNVQGVVLVQMIDGRKIKFEAFPKASQVSGFTENAKIYER